MNWLELSVLLLFWLLIMIIFCGGIYAVATRPDDLTDDEASREIDRLIREADIAVAKRSHLRVMSPTKGDKNE